MESVPVPEAVARRIDSVQGLRESLQKYAIWSVADVRHELEKTGLYWMVAPGTRLTAGDSGRLAQRLLTHLTYIHLPDITAANATKSDPYQMTTHRLLEFQGTGMRQVFTENGNRWSWTPERGPTITAEVAATVEELKLFAHLTGLDSEILGRPIDLGPEIHDGVLKLAEALSCETERTGSRPGRAHEINPFVAKSFTRLFTDLPIALYQTLTVPAGNIPAEDPTQILAIFAQDRSAEMSSAIGMMMLPLMVPAAAQIGRGLLSRLAASRMTLDAVRIGLLTRAQAAWLAGTRALADLGIVGANLLSLDIAAGRARFLVREAGTGALRVVRWHGVLPDPTPTASATAGRVPRHAAAMASPERNEGMENRYPTPAEAALPTRQRLDPKWQAFPSRIDPATITARPILDVVQVGNLTIIRYRALSGHNYAAKHTYSREAATYFDNSGDSETLRFYVRYPSGYRQANRDEIEREFTARIPPSSIVPDENGNRNWLFTGLHRAHLEKRTATTPEWTEEDYLYWNQSGTGANPGHRLTIAYSTPLADTHFVKKLTGRIGSLPHHLLQEIDTVFLHGTKSDISPTIWGKAAQGDNGRYRLHLYDLKNENRVLMQSTNPDVDFASDTLTHEIGHVLEGENPEIRDYLWMTMKLDETDIPGDYAKTHWREQFAESIKERVRNSKFDDHYPHRAALIDAVLAGRIGRLRPEQRMGLVALILSATAAAAETETP